MSNTCLVVFVGIPGSGKTTLCNTLINHMKASTSFQTALFNYDQLCSQFSKEERKTILNEIQSLISSNKAIQVQQLIIFIDDNNYYKSMRKEYLNLAKQFQIGYVEIYMKISLELALIRNDARPVNISQDIIRKMYHKFEEPVTAASHDLVIVDGNSNIVKISCQIEETIRNAFTNPINNAAAVKNKTSAPPPPLNSSKLQTVDLLLRQIVREKVVQAGNAPLVGLRLNNIKRVVFLHIKNNLSLLDFVDEDSSTLYNFLKGLFINELGGCMSR